MPRANIYRLLSEISGSRLPFASCVGHDCKSAGTTSYGRISAADICRYPWKAQQYAATLEATRSQRITTDTSYVRHYRRSEAGSSPTQSIVAMSPHRPPTTPDVSFKIWVRSGPFCCRDAADTLLATRLLSLWCLRRIVLPSHGQVITEPYHCILDAQYPSQLLIDVIMYPPSGFPLVSSTIFALISI